MAARKRTSLNHTLQVSVGGTSTGYASLGDLVDIDGWGSVTKEEIDTTLLGDFYKSSIPGQADPGEVSFTYVWDDSDAGNKSLVALMERGPADIVPLWLVTPYTITTTTGSVTGTERQFSGWLKGIEEMGSRTEMNTRKISIRRTGDPGMST